jgi:hypothetical protein
MWVWPGHGYVLGDVGSGAHDQGDDGCGIFARRGGWCGFCRGGFGRIVQTQEEAVDPWICGFGRRVLGGFGGKVGEGNLQEVA